MDEAGTSVLSFLHASGRCAVCRSQIGKRGIFSSILPLANLVRIVLFVDVLGWRAEARLGISRKGRCRERVMGGMDLSRLPIRCNREELKIVARFLRIVLGAPCFLAKSFAFSPAIFEVYRPM